MIFMQNILNNLKKELMYQYFSRIFFIITLLISALMIWSLFMQTTQTKDKYNLYLRTEAEYKKDGIDIEKALKSPMKIDENTESNGDKSEVIENILRYDYESLSYSIYAIKPNQILSTSLEWVSFIFLPMIFMIYGIYIATYDRKYKTLKIKSIQYNWKHLIISKQLSMYISGFIMLTISFLSSYIVGRIFYIMITKEIPVEQFQPAKIPSDKNIFIQCGMIFFIVIIFSTLGFCLGVLFKGILIPTLIFVLYNFAIPILGVYDIRNMIAVLGHQVFNFLGNFKLFIPSDMPIGIASLLLISFVLLLTLITYVVFGKQSKYIT